MKRANSEPDHTITLTHEELRALLDVLECRLFTHCKECRNLAVDLIYPLAHELRWA